MRKLKVLDLFSGIGGFSLGLERTGGFETVAFCEIEEFPRKVLNKHWPDVPIYEDVRLLDGEEIKTNHGRIDLICGGYPCQPFSNAGKRKGAEDDRHLWPEVLRLMASIRPCWGLFENVAGHINLGLDTVLSDLEDEGYTSQAVIIPACALNAPHRRDRVWIITHSNSNSIRSYNKKINTDEARINAFGEFIGLCGDVPNSECTTSKQRSKSSMQRRRKKEAKQVGLGSGGIGKNVANSKIMQRNGSDSKPRCKISEFGDSCSTRRERMQWADEPNVGRVANGIPGRVDRLRGLGNSVVPQIPELIGYAILEAERKNQ